MGFFSWIGNFIKEFASLFVVFIISVAVCAGLLYAFNIFWALYVSTPIGRQFIKLFGSDAAAIERILSYRPLFLSVHINLVVVKICIAGGAIGRLLLLVRYLYEYRGFWGRLFFWGVPCICLSAYFIRISFNFEWTAALLLSAICTLVLLNRCIQVVSRLLPEIRFLK